MKKTNIILLSIALLPFALFAGVKTGDKAPDFSGVNDLGETVSLSDLEGKYVVLEWFNHGCPFVKKHYKSGNMQATQKKLTDAGVVWLSINSSAEGKQGYATAEQSVKDRAAHGSNASHVIMDPEGTIGRLYEAKTTPHMFVIDPEGVLVYQGAIDSIRSANPKDVAKAENYVLAAYEALVNGKQPANATTRAYGCSVKF